MLKIKFSHLIDMVDKSLGKFADSLDTIAVLHIDSSRFASTVVIGEVVGIG